MRVHINRIFNLALIKVYYLFTGKDLLVRMKEIVNQHRDSLEAQHITRLYFRLDTEDGHIVYIDEYIHILDKAVFWKFFPECMEYLDNQDSSFTIEAENGHGDKVYVSKQRAMEFMTKDLKR